AAAPQLVGAYRVRHLVRGPPQDALVAPCGLVGRVVGQLVLEEDRLAVLPVPDDVVFLVVLDEEAGRGDAVAVDDDAGVRGVESPADAVAVIGPPGPDVVEDDAVAVDLEADLGPAHVGAAYAEEHVLDRGGLRRWALGLKVGPVTGADLKQHR